VHDRFPHRTEPRLTPREDYNTNDDDMSGGRNVAILIVSVLLLVGSVTAGGADWDDGEGEFEAPQQRQFDEKLAAKETADAAAARAEDAKSRAERLNDLYKARGPMFEWKYEGVAIAILVLYVVNYLVGNSANKQMARDWESAFCKSDGVFAKNFSVMGADGAGPSKDSLLAREAADEYKFYASGRRFCEGVMVTLKLRSRNDLFSAAYDMMYHTAEPDLCVVECFMNDECVSQGSVFAIGDRARIATLEGSADDVKRLTAVYSPKDAKGKNAAASSMVVKAESAELANDVVTEVACDAVLGEKAANTSAAEHLVHIHCTDESKGAAGGGSSHKKVLRLTFKLPAPGGGPAAMEAALGDLLPLAPHFIDVVVGLYELNPVYPLLESAWFRPLRTLNVISWFLQFAFKCNVYRYIEGRVHLSAAQKDKAEKARQRRKEEDFKADLKVRCSFGGCCHGMLCTPYSTADAIDDSQHGPCNQSDTRERQPKHQLIDSQVSKPILTHGSANPKARKTRRTWRAPSRRRSWRR
jgi:hypothetical protein